MQLTADTRHASLSGYIDSYVDASGKLTYAQVRQVGQVGFSKQDIHLSDGYSSDAHWFRFRLARNADAARHWILSLGEPYLNNVDVWVNDRDGSLRSYHLGDHAKYADRPLQTRLFNVPLELSDTVVTVYIRVQSTSSINFTAELLRPDAFTAQETRSNLYHGVYFGVLCITIVLYLLLGIWLRDGGMLAYASYVAILFLAFLSTNGYVAVLFPSSVPWLNDLLTGFGTMGVLVTITLLWVYLLDLKKHFPRIARVYLIAGLVGCCSLPFVATPYYRLVAPLVMQIGIFIALLNLVLLVVLWWQQRQAELLLYFFAFITSIIGSLLAIGTTMAWIPYHPLTSNAYEYATFVHVLVMSLGLALRLRQIQRGKARAEKEAFFSSQRVEEQRRFVAMLSHEFRNPLAAIDRAAQMLQFKLQNIGSDDSARLEKIRTWTGTLSGLVDNFLAAEVLDQHKALALAPVPCRLRPLLERVIHMLGETTSERVTLLVLPEDAVYTLDRDMIEMAVGNLVGNALRYTPQDSQVTVSARVDDGGLFIQVEDQGEGLSSDELKQLGVPYYRASTSLGKKGSGLGYYFTRRVAEAHGGTLQAHSVPGQGLQVAIRLPVSPVLLPAPSLVAENG
ncbi:sensor histidine kinase [Microbulbifer rhizosphaerae]|uniref:histidine kinase n=1 Tax=Microbulbifer rhizosphaerae TaxID=1562603 RepID=A0A7W4WEI1_9GAMM|nr:sensor histidine kinase [Microbulbifer rhizosphaerae]MBB3062775.1 signal transduction histidine kinase [Microbulbifer rhizosphaerae]